MIVLLLAIALDVSASAGAAQRRLHFKDRLTPALAGWQSGVLGTYGLALEAYPATGRLPVIDDIGVTLSYRRSLQSSTLTADQQLAFDTQQIAWDAGLRWRVLRDGRERYALSMSYGTQRFDFTGGHLPGYVLPAGTTQFWRPGAEARAYAGPLTFALGAAYLAVVRHDFLATYFPRASTGGVEGTARISAEVWKLDVRLSARYTRLFSSLHPLPYDPYIAGGALDEVFAVDLGCAVRL